MGLPWIDRNENKAKKNGLSFTDDTWGGNEVVKEEWVIEKKGSNLSSYTQRSCPKKFTKEQ